MRLLWTGTDALMMIDISKRKLRKKPFWLVMRLVIKFLDWVHVEGHLTNATWIKEELQRFGLKKPIDIMMTPLKHTTAYPKKKHEGINVLYYKPPRGDLKWRDWLYGIDLIDRLEEEYKGIVNFIVVDQTQDMAKVFPITDLYIRPNRHDGHSRLIRECDIQKIPYYWTHKDPDYNQLKAKLDKYIK